MQFCHKYRDWEPGESLEAKALDGDALNDHARVLANAVFAHLGKIYGERIIVGNVQVAVQIQADVVMEKPKLSTT
jgi:hypothetical protein